MKAEKQKEKERTEQSGKRHSKTHALDKLALILFPSNTHR